LERARDKRASGDPATICALQGVATITAERARDLTDSYSERNRKKKGEPTSASGIKN